MRRLLFFITTTLLWGGEHQWVVENSNFVLNAHQANQDYTYDYNRLRLHYNNYYDNFSTVVKVDHEAIFGSKILNSPTTNMISRYEPDIPFDTAWNLASDPFQRVKIYRAFTSYITKKHTVNVGLQRVAFGVGRVWTPVDMFNPLQSLSLETGERRPVLAAHYSYALDETAHIEVVTSQQKNLDIKGALKLKGNLREIDMALLTVQERTRTLYGYELQGELFSTGIELRSEGGVFTNVLTQKSFIKYIVGVDYAFENSLILGFEYLYNQTDLTQNYALLLAGFAPTIDDIFTDVVLHKDAHYGALTASYQFNTLLHGMGLVMHNMVDASTIIVPSLSYSASDESTLNIGAFLSMGDASSEFGARGTIMFANLTITF